MRQFTRDGLVFDVRDSAGDVDGTAGAPGAARTAVLLHGFPQDSHAWTGVTPLLVEGGFRVLAPDLRGYSPGARPTSRSAYRLEVLAEDVLALLDQAGVDRAHVVGHDWGGALAWELATRHPGRVSRLTVLSTPHPAALAWAMRHSTQALRSWYMAAVQVPVIPERVLAARVRRRGLSGFGLPAEQEQAYRARLLTEEGWRGGLSWYRGRWARPAPDVAPVLGPVRVPTTYVWGRQDAYLGRAAAYRTARHVDAPYRFVELDADHWLPEKHPREVASAVLSDVH
ncbi:Pimeloyl-ACP methyl ester carboxylesterase [Austwickia chelonae]|uniref:Putative hydrolase n=1 Tax=Austwickia chelonae NBRC 105200 TaxID=1184607 RepID=K6VR37_9MICO|nr:alpha/beta fold hydrolase [Austwickia chelonae]GAB79214.1 putative hydrolase [Austwickia chelonae NBRC 105200]SEW37291.1 Pimeloyl-ACP methyl ester carboxylesterase [Austwickia chelonae]